MSSRHLSSERFALIREDPHRPAEPLTADADAHLPVFDDFARLTDPALYPPLPDEWVLGISDIVQSTATLAAGRYKVVNTAAAAVIAAVANALGVHDFPFVFGGDGASLALPSEHAELAPAALASVATWVRDDLELQMRVALIPIEAVRANGFDVRGDRFAPSPDVSIRKHRLNLLARVPTEPLSRLAFRRRDADACCRHGVRPEAAPTVDPGSRPAAGTG
jgi:hypothetical protein